MSLAAITFSQIIKISLFSSNITWGRIIFIWGEEIFLRVLDIFPTIMCMTASVWVGQGVRECGDPIRNYNIRRYQV